LILKTSKILKPTMKIYTATFLKIFKNIFLAEALPRPPLKSPTVDF